MVQRAALYIDDSESDEAGGAGEIDRDGRGARGDLGARRGDHAGGANGVAGGAGRGRQSGGEPGGEPGGELGAAADHGGAEHLHTLQHDAGLAVRAEPSAGARNSRAHDGGRCRRGGGRNEKRRGGKDVGEPAPYSQAPAAQTPQGDQPQERAARPMAQRQPVRAVNASRAHDLCESSDESSPPKSRRSGSPSTTKTHARTHTHTQMYSRTHTQGQTNSLTPEQQAAVTLERIRKSKQISSSSRVSADADARYNRDTRNASDRRNGSAELLLAD
mmetsp:Transcript_32983/g.69399  ORF Transcript_32983/g.69399 Transcript_32983/m.69399 type:complete len:274 (-) Transcript_32983:999-1820(-)